KPGNPPDCDVDHNRPQADRPLTDSRERSHAAQQQRGLEHGFFETFLATGLDRLEIAPLCRVRSWRRHALSLALRSSPASAFRRWGRSPCGRHVRAPGPMASALALNAPRLAPVSGFA